MARNNTSPNQSRRRRNETSNRRTKKKVCQFCTEKGTKIDYKDTALLRKFMSDRAKIRARRVTGNCPRHQREVAIAIRNSREMALLPYVTIK